MSELYKKFQDMMDDDYLEDTICFRLNLSDEEWEAFSAKYESEYSARWEA